MLFAWFLWCWEELLHELQHPCPRAGSLKKFLPSVPQAGLHGNRGLSSWFNHPCWLFWLQEQGKKVPQTSSRCSCELGRCWRESLARHQHSNAGTGKSGLVFEQADESTASCSLWFLCIFFFLLLSKHLIINSVNDEA